MKVSVRTKFFIPYQIPRLYNKIGQLFKHENNSRFSQVFFPFQNKLPCLKGWLKFNKNLY